MSYTIKVILNNSSSLVTSPVSEWAKEQVKDSVIGGLQAVGELLLDFSYSVALVGGVVCILLWLSGWRSGNRWAGILFMAHVLIRFLLGGV